MTNLITEFQVGKSLKGVKFKMEFPNDIFSSAVVCCGPSISKCACVRVWARAAEVECELIKQNQENRKEQRNRGISAPKRGLPLLNPCTVEKSFVSQPYF